MKDKSLYQQLKAAQKEERVTCAKSNKVINERNNEITEVVKPIEEKYAPILEKSKKEWLEANSNVWSLGGIYNDYSSFSVKAIVDTYALLLSYIEGEKFIPYRDYKNHEICENSIIIKESANNECEVLTYDIIDELYKTGDIVQLSSGFTSFVSLYDNIGEKNYKFGKYNYLYEFTNRLIQYRIDNNLRKSISEEEIYNFLCDFIMKHPDLVNKNKDKREEMLNSISEEETSIGTCKKLNMRINNK